MIRVVRKFGLPVVCGSFVLALLCTVGTGQAAADDVRVKVAPAIVTSDNGGYGGASIQLVHRGGWGGGYGGWGGGYRGGYGYGGGYGGGWGRSYYGGYYSRPFVGVSIGYPSYYRGGYGYGGGYGGYYGGGYPYYGGGYYGGCW